MKRDLAVIVTAAGSSMRFSAGGEKKEYCLLQGKSVLYRSCAVFFDREDVAALCVTYPAGGIDGAKRALGGLATSQHIPVFFVEGGATRQESVRRALTHLRDMNETLGVKFVAIHDGARPFVSADLLERVVAATRQCGAAVPGLEETDTTVRVVPSSISADAVHCLSDGLSVGSISETVSRNSLYRLQTPQVFSFPEILDSHDNAALRGKSFSDDSTLFLDAGFCVSVVPGNMENIKITYSSDLQKADATASRMDSGNHDSIDFPEMSAALSNRRFRDVEKMTQASDRSKSKTTGFPERILSGDLCLEEQCMEPIYSNNETPACNETHACRVGTGWDLHRVSPERRLVLGGVEIPTPDRSGLLGHSDADVLLHAIIDAVFGALSLGDIGDHFPPTDPRYKDISSSVLFKEALCLANKKGWRPLNIDSTVIFDTVRLSPYKREIEAKIASIAHLDPSAVSVKAKSSEGIFGSAIPDVAVAQAVVLMGIVR